MARRKPEASSTDATLADAKDRLDRLIRNARDQSLMPITIAETLRRLAAGEASLDEPDRIRKDSYHWCQAICERLFSKPLSLNRSYWDKLFASHMPAEALAALDAENRRGKGVVEAYVYARLRQTVEGLQAVRSMIVSAEPASFSLDTFLAAFENERRLRRSIDKAYEIAVHALFNAVAARVQARITVSVATTDPAILTDFRDFCRVLLGVSDTQPEITIPARLYRVGGTNSRDGGVDLWANFGPAVQVKHITLDEESAAPLADSVGADQLVVVCRDIDKAAIERIMEQTGLNGRIRGFITKTDLVRWYALAVGPRHAATMARPLLKALAAEFEAEFTLSDPSRLDSLTTERGYSEATKTRLWAICETH